VKSKNTSIKSRLDSQINTAFTMSLTAGSLVDFFGQKNDVTLTEYDQIMHQLKWISKQCRNILSSLSIHNPEELSNSYLTLESISERLISQIENFKLAITKGVMANQYSIRSLEGKSYALYQTTQHLYKMILEINEK